MDLSTDTGSTNSEIDVDSLLAEINAPAPERAMTGGQDSTAPAPQAPVPEPTPIQEYEFDWNGKRIKAPIDKLTQWASQGYDYSQKMEQFKLKQQDLEKKYQPYEKFKVVDEYVKKDPGWWKFVEEQYQNRLTSEDPTVQRVKGLLEEQLTPFREMLAAQETAKQQEQIVKEDSALANEMKSIRTKYSDLDFDKPDAEGKSLEYKVLEHGSKHSFPSFQSAFLDFYHEQLEKRWEAKGREAISKDTQKRAQLGLSANPTPKQKDEGFDVKGKSWSQVYNDVIASL